MKPSTPLFALLAIGITPSFAGSDTQAVDFAEARHCADWFRHPVVGDPSFDSFQRNPVNPICVGAPPLPWPVNAFLFEDPVSGDWFVYVGEYPVNYRGDGKTASRCIPYRSKDHGRTWERLGPIWPDDLTSFDSDGKRQGNLPDVSVVYADGKYHMIHDWSRPDHSDGGLGYAVADRPEGPFTRARAPIYATKGQPLRLGKYRRLYGGTLVRRKSDWLILAMADSAQFQSWALVAITASRPDGPYSEPVFVRCVDRDYYHPPLMEFYPTFVHEGYVYAPSTSVALNRDFQMLFRAPLEKAAKPDAWGIVQEGSLWHAADVAHEHDGMWGQTFTGFVDKHGIFQVAFPSRNPARCGTINLASRPWNQPLRERGFHLSGHGGPSLTFLRRGYNAFQLDATLRLRGAATLLWNYRPRIGPNQPTADATLHPLSLTRYDGLEMDSKSWRIISVDEHGARTINTNGAWNADGPLSLRVERDTNGVTRVACANQPLWSGQLRAEAGTIGLLVAKNSHLGVERFAVAGVARSATVSFLATEALLDAGANRVGWTETKEPSFRFGLGAIHAAPGGRAKWNFEGTGFALWSPRGPSFGKAEVRLDGERLEVLDLHADATEQSKPLLSRTSLPRGRHALVLQAVEGALVVDSLDAME